MNRHSIIESTYSYILFKLSGTNAFHCEGSFLLHCKCFITWTVEFYRPEPRRFVNYFSKCFKTFFLARSNLMVKENDYSESFGLFVQEICSNLKSLSWTNLASVRLVKNESLTIVRNSQTYFWVNSIIDSLICVLTWSLDFFE